MSDYKRRDKQITKHFNKARKVLNSVFSDDYMRWMYQEYKWGKLSEESWELLKKRHEELNS